MLNRRKDKIDLFNDVLNTFYLQLCVVGHVLKNKQVTKKETYCQPSVPSVFLVVLTPTVTITILLLMSILSVIYL